MRLVNENFETIKKSEVDLSKGCLVTTTAIKEDVKPIDNIEKFAWADDDYEEVQMYCLYGEVKDGENTAQEDTDAMLIDHEYRLTLLELGV